MQRIEGRGYRVVGRVYRVDGKKGEGRRAEGRGQRIEDERYIYKVEGRGVVGWMVESINKLERDSKLEGRGYPNQARFLFLVIISTFISIFALK